jgi:P4 family phage/plasmid primase-like protien
MNFRYTTITTDRPVSKRFVIENGKVKKQGAMPITTGQAEVIETDLRNFAVNLKQFKPNQVLLPGVLLNGQSKIGITTRAKPKPGHIPRVREHFKFDSVCLFPIDHDQGHFENTQEFDAAMDTVLPGFSGLERFYRKSNSGSVFKDGKQVFPQLKFHCYILLKLSGNPPEAIRQVNDLSKIILVRAWNAGHGYCFITKSGSVIDRCLVDVAILGRPEGVMYEGMPVLGKGLTYQDAGCFYQEGNGQQFLDVSTIKPLSDNEQKQCAVLSAKEHKRIDRQVNKVRDKYEQNRIEEIAETSSISATEASQIIRSALDEKLSLSWPVTLDSGETLLISDLMASPEKYDKVRMHDPLEPEYGRCKARFYFNGDNSIIHSLAHGLKKKFVIMTGRAETTEIKYRWSDLGNAERLVAAHGHDLRYCHPFGKWFVWDGRCWANDKTGATKRKCKSVIRHLYYEAAKEKNDIERKKLIDYTRKCESDQKIKAMLSLAQSEPSIPILPEDLDTNPWLLNCLNGTVNLKTGKLQPHRREDLITKLAPFNYDPSIPCDAWLAHLCKIMGDDHELIGFLQRAFGYSLTGDTSERVIFIEWGTGANGKSITNDCIAMALGDYAMRTPTETLLTKRNEGILNDVARLMGARFVYAAEAEQGKRLAESQIKDISGGEKIAARFMRGEWFEFHPEFKIWLGTNHKPVIRGTENAIWDRIRLIPFNVRIPENERLPKATMMELFRDEMPGILAWLVEGCLEWGQHGLMAPDAVLTATRDYRDEMDTLGDFFDAMCVIGKTVMVTAKQIYESYDDWCEAEGEKPISKKLFGMKLAERGFDSFRGNRGVRTWTGIGIKSEQKD